MKHIHLIVISAILLMATTGFMGCTTTEPGEGVTILRIFHHGSIAPAMQVLENIYENDNDNIDVRRERSPSSEAVRKVTDLQRQGDIVMTGDYNIIKEMMLPDHASWWIRYSTNQISIAHTSSSKYASTITSSNWFDILSRDDVKIGIADPNVGPDGYRALIAIQLAEVAYGQANLFRDIIGNNSAIESIDQGEGNYRIGCPEDLNPDTSKIVFRHTPVALLPLLETGEIDYAFQYYSDARSYSDNNPDIKVLELEPAVNLGNSSYLKSYNAVTIVQYSDMGDMSIEVSGDLIANGFTIPKNAENTKDAIKFIKLLLGSEGKTRLSNIYVIPMDKAETNDRTALPMELRSLVA